MIPMINQEYQFNKNHPYKLFYDVLGFLAIALVIWLAYTYANNPERLLVDYESLSFMAFTAGLCVVWLLRSSYVNRNKIKKLEEKILEIEEGETE